MGAHEVFNRCGGTLTAALQMDYVPALASSAFFVMRFSEPEMPAGGISERLLSAGQAIQRFWLAATRLGLAVQPTVALLIFADYGATDAAFTIDPVPLRRARQLAERFQRLLGVAPSGVFFMGRIGEPTPRLPLYRSTRLPLDQLLQT